MAQYQNYRRKPVPGHGQGKPIEVVERGIEHLEEFKKPSIMKDASTKEGDGVSFYWKDG